MRAYNELEKEGRLVTQARRGVLIASHPLLSVYEAGKQQLRDAVAQLLTTAEQLNATPVETYAEIERQLRSRARHELPVQAFFQAGIARVADDDMIE